MGYQQKEGTYVDSEGEELDSGYQYITSTFRKIGGTKVSIQDFQMSSDVGTGASDFQRLDFGGFYTSLYYWVNGEDCEYWGLELPEGANGVWGKPVYTITVNPKTGKETKKLTGYELPTGDEAVVTEGEMFQILTAKGNTVNFAGQVAEEDIDFLFDFSGDLDDEGGVPTSGYRYIGNAFPTDMSVQNFQMSADVGTGASDFQRFAADGFYTTLYYWVNGEDCEYWGLELPEGANGVWGKPVYTITVNPKTGKETKKLTGYELPGGDEAIVPSGNGVQILGSQGNVCTLLCPYQLTK